MPSIVANIQDKQNIARWKKTYSVLNNAFNATRADGVELCAAHGHPAGSHLCTNKNPDSKLQSGLYNPEFIEVFLSKLKVVKTCGSDPYQFFEPCKDYKDSFVWYCTNGNNCYAPLGVKREMHSEWRSQGVKDFLGPKASEGLFWQQFGVQATLLEDGTVLYFGKTNFTVHILVDVNGWKQGPNTLGRDLFAVQLNENQMLPSGAMGTYGYNNESYGASGCSKDIGRITNGVTSFFEAPGAGCSAKYLSN